MILIGATIVVSALLVLLWHEGHAVKLSRILFAARRHVHTELSNRQVQEGLENQLVHLTGIARSSELLEDPLFGIQSPNSLRLERIVEMYQRSGSPSGQPDRTVANNRKRAKSSARAAGWQTLAADESTNRWMPVRSADWTANRICFGAYQLTPHQLEAVAEYRFLEVETATLSAELKSRQVELVRAGGDGWWYLQPAESSPSEGDLRVRWRVWEPTPLSLIATQRGDGFVASEMGGGELALFESGEHSAEALLNSAVSRRYWRLWLYRLACLFSIALGIGFVLRPLVVFSDAVPFGGGLIGAGVISFSLLASTVAVLLTVGLSWFLYRPQWAFVLFLFAGGLFILLRRITRASPE